MGGNYDGWNMNSVPYRMLLHFQAGRKPRTLRLKAYKEFDAENYPDSNRVTRHAPSARPNLHTDWLSSLFSALSGRVLD